MATVIHYLWFKYFMKFQQFNKEKIYYEVLLRNI